MTKKKIHFNVKNPPITPEYPPEIDSWINAGASDKKTLPTSDKIEDIKKMSLLIPTALHRRIKQQCASEGISMKEKILDLLYKEFSNN